MAKYRVSYGDGSPLGQYDNLSEVHTVLDHSAPGWKDRTANRTDDHNFDVNDAEGKPQFTVTGPRQPVNRDSEPQG